jgi:hypothetical protein
MDRFNIHLVSWIAGFTLLLGLSRIIPHPPNFTPILAVSIFVPLLTGNWKHALPLTLGAMFIGDLYWGLHSYMLWTYSSIAIISMIALRYSLLANCFIAPILFFIVTNFGVWTTGYYGYTLEGLIACYVAAVPFFHMTLLGTIVYTGLFYGIYKSTNSLYRTV